MEAALQIRGDAPRRNNYAGLLLATGEVEKAASEIALALQEYPEYALAHATLASVHLARMEGDLARVALLEAERLDRGLPVLPMLWAHYHATQGDFESAVEKAREGVALRPDDAQSHFMLARICRQAGKYDEMRRSARAVLDLTAESKKSEMRQLITRMLGPTALEAPDDEVEGGDDLAGSAVPATPMPEPGEFKLGKGLRLLEDGDTSKSPTPTLGGDAPGAKKGSPLLLLGDQPKLQLRGSDSKLELKP
jgi:tetratricopeptide (TPR) repeat protein